MPRMDFASDQTHRGRRSKHSPRRNRLGFGDYQAVARLALSGTNVGPSITGMMRVLGRERVLARFQRFLAGA